MFELRQTIEFEDWLADLRDNVARKAIGKRIIRLQSGLFGDAKPVGEGVSELRFKIGPGYRVYFQQRGGVLILLLCGGDKSTQSNDIKRAKAIAAQMPPSPGSKPN
jgi:putative addiction module killer protein